MTANRPTDPEVFLDELVTSVRRIEVTLELMEQSLGVLVWQGMPWLRRLAASWRDARATVNQTEDEYTKLIS